jgi:hypothetical protein
VLIYLRLTYILQFVAGISLLLALFLPWHTTTHSVASLLYTTLNQLGTPHQFEMLGTPAWMTGFLFPVALLSVMRGLLGSIDRRKIALLKFARRAAYLGAFPIVWFYANDGELAKYTAHGIGHLQFGFWLSTSSGFLLFILILVETSLPSGIDYPQYVACPVCDRTVRRGTRRCPHCGQLIYTG